MKPFENEQESIVQEEEDNYIDDLIENDLEDDLEYFAMPSIVFIIKTSPTTE